VKTEQANCLYLAMEKKMKNFNSPFPVAYNIKSFWLSSFLPPFLRLWILGSQPHTVSTVHKAINVHRCFIVLPLFNA